MKPIYEHTQTGTASLFFLGLPILMVVLAVLLSNQPEALLPLFFIVAFLLSVMLIFRSLTVRVDFDNIQISFGLNAFCTVIPCRQITGVSVVRNPLWMGLGIHFIRQGMIYNVSGLGGVEISLSGGRRVRIGSDEPAVLAQAIQQAAGIS